MNIIDVEANNGNVGTNIIDVEANAINVETNNQPYKTEGAKQMLRPFVVGRRMAGGLVHNNLVGKHEPGYLGRKQADVAGV